MNWIGLLLILTHIACVALGAVLMRWFTLRTVQTWPEPPHPIKALEGKMLHHHDPDEDTATRTERVARDGIRLSVALIMAGVFVIVIGLQALNYQREQAADEKARADAVIAQDVQLTCINEWGDLLVDTIKNNVQGNRRLERAEGKLGRADSKRDGAIDRILLTVIAFRAIPPQADDADFTRALRDYQNALRVRDEVKGARNTVQAEVDGVREENPYPRLQCGVEEAEDSEPSEE